MSAHDVFDVLPGIWDLSRIIPGRGRLDGQVRFSPSSANQLFCEETGLLQLDQIVQTFDANRSYLYELRDDRLFIFYNDGDRSGEVLHERVFADETGTDRATHCHVCAADTYDLTMTLVSPHKIEMVYKVHGPQKNYTMESVLTRAASHPS